MALQPAVLGSRLNTFPLNYIPAAVAAARLTKVKITLADVPVKVRKGSVTIHDALNDSPNTCSLTIDGSESPQTTQRLRITINSDTPRLLFDGALQTVDQSYEGLPEHIVFPCTAIDDTPRANRRLPFGSWTDVSATDLAQELVTTFAPGFTATHVQTDLPAVSINLDGSEGLNGALRQIVNLIGGYFYWEDSDLHLFIEEAADAPDDIDDTPGRFCDEPPIRRTADDSQIRTRVFGKGHGEATLSEVAAGDTVIPLADVTMFNPAGGKAISETQRLGYTGVEAGGVGSLAGPGVLPSVAPTLAAAPGTGLTAGTYKYAYTDVTAAGESLPSPLGTVVLSGVQDPPSAAPTPSLVAGSGLGLGTYQYAVTFLNPSGETTGGPVSASVSSHDVPNPSTAPTIAEGGSSQGTSSWNVGDSMAYVTTFATPSGETLAGPLSNVITATVAFTFGGVSYARLILLNNIPVPTDPAVTAKYIYRRRNGSYVAKIAVALSSTGFIDGSAAPAGTPPGANTAYVRQVQLSSIPVGPTGTTGRKLYRTVAGGSQLKLLTTVSDNSTTTYADSTADGSLGANAPTTNTATMLQVALSGIALGPTGTTSRKIYRTVVGGSQLKLQQTIANNTATTGVTDATADGSLGANAPTGDTSGLSQPTGQVNAGSTTLLTAGAGPFSAAGGWVVAGSGNVVRYTGITGNTLTGIPASGIGAITTTIPYGTAVVAAPALTGVTGLVLPLLKGAPVNILVQRDDLAAQAELAARDGSDGIAEHLIVDERRGEASLIALCDSDLALFSRPIVTVTYASRDVKTKSGKPVVINVTTPAIDETLTIQDVQISEIDIVDGLPPKFTVTASSVRFSLDDLLRRLLAEAA